jgi:hypothetical protein
LVSLQQIEVHQRIDYGLGQLHLEAPLAVSLAPAIAASAHRAGRQRCG